jgi:hypothetical protein
MLEVLTYVYISQKVSEIFRKPRIAYSKVMELRKRAEYSNSCRPRFPLAFSISAVSEQMTFTGRALGFRQFSFHHAIRVLLDMQISGFFASQLLEHAVFPSGFHLQVGSMTQGYHAQPLPNSLAIYHAVMRRTVG